MNGTLSDDATRSTTRAALRTRRSPVKVLLVDDDLAELERLSVALSNEELTVVGTTDSGEHALDLARILDPDVAVIRWSLCHFGGGLTARLMRWHAPGVIPLLLLDTEDIDEVHDLTQGMGFASVMRHVGAAQPEDVASDRGTEGCARNSRGTAGARRTAGGRERMTPSRDERPVFDLIKDMTLDSMERAEFDTRSLMLVRLAALVAVEAPPASYVANLARAGDTALTVDEMQGLLMAISPIVGTPRVVSAVGNIARGLGIDIQPMDGSFA